MNESSSCRLQQHPAYPGNGSSKQPRILLSGVFGPFGVDDEYGRRENIMELFHNQITKAQGPASLRFHHRSFGLYFIAENLDADVTVLDFPSVKRFVRELANGYDIVGISFITPNFLKAKEMARLVRKHSPKSVILIGGHGAAIEGVEKLIDCDHVVIGEGISWMRRFLGQDPGKPVKHPTMPSNDYHRVFGIPMPGITAGLLVPGVGCENGCRFCSTAHFFGKEYTPFISTGKELFEIACRMQKEEGFDTFFVMDENFLKLRDRAMELVNEMEKAGKFFKFHVFASADAVVKFGIRNLVRLGVHLIWIGVESKTGPIFPKNEGIDHKQLIADLKMHGISVLASGILCMEHHTKENIEEDIRHMIELEADMVQFMLLTGLPVTGVYTEHKESLKLRTELPFEEWHGQKELNYLHPEFPDSSAEKFLGRAFREEYEANSSSIYRMTETAARGYRTLSEMAGSDPVIKARARQLMLRMQEYRQLLPAIRRKAVNHLERKRAATLAKEISKTLGPMSLKQIISSAAALAIAEFWSMRIRIFSDTVQPSTRITHYKAGRCVSA